jgi:spermidine synthase
MKSSIYRLLSYYFPISKQIPSIHSGLLDLRYADGKVQLDSRYANHSYGTVQKVLEYALQNIELSNIRSVLLLGLGGGSVIRSLRRKFRYKGRIKAVDIDPLMISIARNEFGIGRNSKTEIDCCEASSYVTKETKKFDLVIVDLFIENHMAKEIFFSEFWCSLKDRVSPKGFIIFNCMHERESTTEAAKHEMKKWGFSIKECNHIECYNTVLIAKPVITWFG